jgi:hypothetical protein
MRRHEDAYIAFVKATERLAKAEKLLADKEAYYREVMEEFRKGMFCGGCNKIRREFPPDQPFPHPGQRPRPPTESELEAKARECDSGLHPLRREVEAARVDLPAIRKKLVNGLEQLRFGKAAWLTAVHLEHRHILVARNEAMAAAEREKESLSRSIRAIQTDMRNMDEALRSEHQKKLSEMVRQRSLVESRIINIPRRTSELEKQWSEAHVMQADEFTRHSILLTVHRSIHAPGILAYQGSAVLGGNFKVAGGFFLMGEVPEAWTSKTNPQVKELVDRYLKTSEFRIGGSYFSDKSDFRNEAPAGSTSKSPSPFLDILKKPDTKIQGE